MGKRELLMSKANGDAHMEKIYSIIGSRLDSVQYTADGVPTSPICHTNDEILAIRTELANAVRDNYIAEYGTNIRTYADVCAFAKSWTDAELKKCTKDGFYNPLTRIGTFDDPSGATSVSQPLLLGPEEVTAMYANGGIAQIILDKKSKGVLLNGFSIKGEKFTSQQLVDLQKYAVSTGFNELSTAILYGNLYGGGELFPILKGDNPLTLAMDERQLMQSGMLKQNCIDRWVSVDRWNTVTIPTYDLCAEDYLNPRSFWVPISGIEVHRDRCARIIPKKQPYWSAIRQLGWGVSDTVSYAAALKGYEIVMMSIPIMCQQMSLLVHQLPLDGIIAQNGIQAARKWQADNEKQLRDWSILNPKAINSFGEIAVVNRTYTGFDNLVDAMRKNISSKSGIPESVLFFSQPNGIFNKSEEDVLLKQSETIRMVQREIAPQVNNVLPYIAVSLWGLPEGEKSWELYKTLTIDFDTPVVSSPSQKAVIAQNYCQAISTMTAQGLPIDQAIAFVAKLTSEVEIPSDMSSITKGMPTVNTNPEVDTMEGEPDETSRPNSQERSSVL